MGDRLPIDRPSRPAERGSASIEAVILYPLLILTCVVLIQGAVWWHARNVASNAAQAGARAASAELSTVAEGETVARSFLDIARGSQFLTQVDVVPVRTTTTATVTVRGTAMSLVPGFDPTFSQSAAMPVERVTNPDAP